MTGYTESELNTFSKEKLIQLFLSRQEQINRLNDNMERLIEQIRIMNSHRFGRKTEKLNEIDGQLSFFDEVENCCDLDADEPELEIVVRKVRRKKQKGQREPDLEGLPEEEISHPLTDEQLDAHYGSGNWRRLPDDTYARLRFTPASWTV